MINISTKDKTRNIIQKTQNNILVTDENGKEIKNIASLKIHTEVDDVIRADVSTFVSDLNINAHPKFNNTYIDDEGFLYKRVKSESDVILDITGLNSLSREFIKIIKNG